MLKTLPITVLICIFKETDAQIHRALNSFLLEEYRPYELLVVNDNPANQRSDVKQSIELACRQAQVSLHWINNSRNIGLTESLNKAIQCISSDYIARLDPDDISLPGRLYRQYTFMSNNSHLVLASGPVMFTNSISSKFPPVNRIVLRLYSYFGNPYPHSTWLVKTEVLRQFPYPRVKTSQDYALFRTLLDTGLELGSLKGSAICIIDNQENKHRISQSKKVEQRVTWDT